MIESCRRLYMLLLSDGVSEHFNNQKRFHMFTFRSPGYRGERKGGGGICEHIGDRGQAVADALLSFV